MSRAVSDREFVQLAHDEASSVAIWSWSELRKLPSWRWARRRYLNRVFEQKTDEARDLQRALDKDLLESDRAAARRP